MALWDLYRFDGRIGRLSFALTQIGVFTASYVLTFLMIIFSGAGDETAAGITWADQTGVGLAIAFLLLNGAWISLAASIKRCHDRDLSGWMLLFVFPPLLGQLWLVLSLVTGEGTAGRDRFGAREPMLVDWSGDLSQRRALA